jgi:hypothetical protein
MAGSLGTLVLELAANSARLQSDMGKAVGIVERGVARMTSVARGIAGGALVAGFTAAASRAIKFGDDLNKAAIKAGLGAKAISELAYAARMSDIDLNSLSTSLRRMQVALSEASTGAKGPNEALRALGLRIEELKGLGADQQFEIIADRINQLEDPADRARAAVDLFGKAGADLLPLFEQGAEGIRAARQEAEKMGQSFSEKQIKALADADTAVKQLRASWEGFATSLTANAAPAISKILSLLHGDANGVFGGGGNAVGSLSEQLKFAESRLALAVQGGYSPRIKEMREEVERLQMVMNGVDDFASRQARARDGSGSAGGYFSAATEWEQIYKDMTELANVTVTGKKVGPARIVEEYDEVLKQAQSDTEDFIRTLEAMGSAGADAANDQLDAELDKQEFYDKMRADWIARDEELLASSRKTFEGMSVYADQAARDIQSYTADQIFNSFDDGLDGMLDSWIKVLRRMAAEAAAAQIFGSKADGGFGLGDLFKLGLSSLGSSNTSGTGVGGLPIVDIGATSSVSPYGMSSLMDSISSGGGASKITVAPVYNIDARGATQDLAKALPAILEANNKQVIEAARIAVRDDQSRRGRM